MSFVSRASRCLVALLTAAFCMATLPVAQAAENGAEQTYFYFVFSNPVAGHEDEYNRWYNEEHAPDVVSVPGFMTAQRFELADEQLRAGSAPMPKYLVVYKIVAADLAAVAAEVNRRMKNGQTRTSPYFDTKTSVGLTYRALGSEIAGAGSDAPNAHGGPRNTYYQFVFANPVAGREDEFNAWYNQHHAPDVSSVPGFDSWQRGILSSEQLNPPFANAAQYVTMFKIQTTDLHAVIQAFQERAPHMTMSSSFDGNHTAGYTYKAIGPLLSGDQIRAERASVGGAPPKSGH